MSATGHNGAVPAATPLPDDAPPGVVAFHAMWSTGSRVRVIRALLTSPRTFAELMEYCELGRPTTYDALMHLVEAGYVTDDAGQDVRRRPSSTVYYPVRERVMADLGAVVAWLGA